MDEIYTITVQVIEDGFYYDFELPRSLVPDDLKQIEEKMKGIIGNGYRMEKEDIRFDEAPRLFGSQPYKLD